jgi:hypothetical protein
MASKVRRPLAPLGEKVMQNTFRRAGHPEAGTRKECWGARTADGVWYFEREESPGTPWLIWHWSSGRLVMMARSLTACRTLVADGTAERQMQLDIEADRMRRVAEGLCADCWFGRELPGHDGDHVTRTVEALRRAEKEAANG